MAVYKSVLRQAPWRAGWLRSQISALRDKGLATAFSRSRYISSYRLDSSRVDYGLARELYRNIADDYKLGAAFARPVINSTAAFMGLPTFTGADTEALAAFGKYLARWRSRLFRINRNVLRDGDVFARLSYQTGRLGAGKLFELQLIPPQWVTPTVDPLTGEYTSLQIVWPMQTETEKGGSKYFDLVETITPEQIERRYDDRAPSSYRAQAGVEINTWGLIPVVHFKNEPEDDLIYGTSDLEPIEPFMKAYHDVMLFAIQGSKMFSQPKVSFSLKDIKSFIQNNFTPQEIDQKKLSFMGKELFFLQEGDEIQFVTADQGLEGTTLLLEFLFYCIVQVSETPEFSFGTAVASSKASVSEQMVPLIKKIERKRGQLADMWVELAQLFFAMQAKVDGLKQPALLEVDLEWPEVDPRDEHDVAATITTLIQGLVEAMQNGLMSQPAAVEFLAGYIPTMLAWEGDEGGTGEQQRIINTLNLLRRMEDAAGFPPSVDEVKT